MEAKEVFKFKCWCCDIEGDNEDFFQFEEEGEICCICVESREVKQ